MITWGMTLPLEAALLPQWSVLPHLYLKSVESCICPRRKTPDYDRETPWAFLLSGNSNAHALSSIEQRWYSGPSSWEMSWTTIATLSANLKNDGLEKHFSAASPTFFQVTHPEQYRPNPSLRCSIFWTITFCNVISIQDVENPSRSDVVGRKRFVFSIIKYTTLT